MMHFLFPTEQFALQLPQSREKVVARLRSEVESPRMFRAGRPQTFFEGTVTDHGFQLRRVVRHRHLPTQIYGRLLPHGGGTHLEVKISVQPAVLAVLILSYCFLALMAAVALLALLMEGSPLMLVVVAAMAGFVFLLTQLNCRGEGDKVKRHLEQVFKLQPSATSATNEAR